MIFFICNNALAEITSIITTQFIFFSQCQQFQVVGNKIRQKQKLRLWRTRILVAVAVAVGIVVLIVVIVVVVVSQQDETPQTNLYLGSFNHGPSNDTS